MVGAVATADGHGVWGGRQGAVDAGGRRGASLLGAVVVNVSRGHLVLQRVVVDDADDLRLSDRRVLLRALLVVDEANVRLRPRVWAAHPAAHGRVSAQRTIRRWSGPSG